MTDETTTPDIGEAAFAAWQKGERSGDYGDFVALLAEPESFEVFSHPLTARGVHRGAEGLTQLLALIAERTKTPNRLEFTNIVRLSNALGDCVFFFDSAGNVAGGFAYRGYNAIFFAIRHGKIAGFREYLGDIDPAWFAPNASAN